MRNKYAGTNQRVEAPDPRTIIRPAWITPLAPTPRNRLRLAWRQARDTATTEAIRALLTCASWTYAGLCWAIFLAGLVGLVAMGWALRGVYP